MKPFYRAIVASTMVFSLTVPALQARADDDVRSSAWLQGQADAKNCPTDPAKCFNNVYAPKRDDSDKSTDTTDPETQALNSADYIAGFIVGKSQSTK